LHVSLIPEPRSTGEQKTKPTQQSVKELRGQGLSPDLIVCRSENPITDSVKDKISNFCHVAKEHVICIHDCTSIFRVPLMLEEQNLVEFFTERLQLNIPLPRPRRLLQPWKELADKHDKIYREVNIALVGKYTKLDDAYASVIKALRHAAIACGYRLNLKSIEASHLEKSMELEDAVKYHEAWQQLCSSNGLLVPGGFGHRGVDGKVAAIEHARKKGIPFLGVCLGLQCAVIEFARNVLGLTTANSGEFEDNCEHQVVIEMLDHKSDNKGGTMRLGKQQTIFDNKHTSTLRQIYGNVDFVEERHRHRYEVNPEYISRLEDNGLKFVGKDTEGKRMEIMELEGHPYFVAVQYHPEYISRPLKPSPPYLGLILAACGKLQTFLARDCQLTPHCLSDDDEDLDDYEIANSNNVEVSADKVDETN